MQLRLHGDSPPDSGMRSSKFSEGLPGSISKTDRHPMSLLLALIARRFVTGHHVTKDLPPPRSKTGSIQHDSTRCIDLYSLSECVCLQS